MVSELIPIFGESLPVGRNFEKPEFRNNGHVIRYQRPQMGSEILGGVTLDTWALSEHILGSSLFQYGQNKFQKSRF